MSDETETQIEARIEAHRTDIETLVKEHCYAPDGLGELLAGPRIGAVGPEPRTGHSGRRGAHRAAPGRRQRPRTSRARAAGDAAAGGGEAMRGRRFAARGVLGPGAVTREEALDARGVVRDFLEALANVSATIGAAARDGAKEVAGLAVQLGRLQPPPALTRGARWGRSRPARAGR